MQYSKPSLSFEEQADQMLRRGFMAPREELIQLLQRVGYYRLSGFLFPFRNSDDTYQSGVDLNLLISLHGFDRDFRLLIFDALERVEISVRAHASSPFPNDSAHLAILREVISALTSIKFSSKT